MWQETGQFFVNPLCGTPLRDYFFSSKAYIFFYFVVDSFVLIVQPHEITFSWYGIYLYETYGRYIWDWERLWPSFWELTIYSQRPNVFRVASMMTRLALFLIISVLNIFFLNLVWFGITIMLMVIFCGTSFGHMRFWHEITGEFSP